MSGGEKESRGDQDPAPENRKPDARAQREARLAEALRRNLAKRKQQSRGRAAKDPEGGSD